MQTISCKILFFFLCIHSFLNSIPTMNSPQHMALFRAANNSHFAEEKSTSSWRLIIITWWEEKKEQQEAKKIAESYKKQGILDRKNLHNKTVLHEAVESNNITAVQALISAGASPKIKNGDGKTALDLATHPSIKRVLSQNRLL